MFARVSTYQGDPDKLDEGTRYAVDQVLPRARQMAGWKGIYVLVDRESGKQLSVTLWESEQDMRASEEAANRLREELAEASDETITDVERYEVAFYEAQGAAGGTLGASSETAQA